MKFVPLKRYGKQEKMQECVELCSEGAGGVRKSSRVKE
ncbi:hypothetical protein HNQ69_001142 [Bartonella callosciuri]|uniref:Uncharacterized protein n=1 Tax=Bartonella callosciuri TaxID=686223 RepID=A0A840NXN0_9HYPH|nr:hypothetical protein [Bartonella callosciuri]